MVNIIIHQGNANQNNSEIPPHTKKEWLRLKTQETTGAGEDLENDDVSSTAGSFARLYNPSGNQSGGSSENLA